MALIDKNFSDLFTFTRASTATDFNNNGQMVSIPADTIRQGYDPTTNLPAGWLVESSAANLSLYGDTSSAVVGVLGSGGSMPTGWGSGGDVGVTTTITGFGVEDGIPYLEVRFQGTSTHTYRSVSFSTLNGLVTEGSLSGSVYARQISAEAVGITSLRSYIRCHYSAGGYHDIQTSYSTASIEKNNLGKGRLNNIGAPAAGALSGSGSFFMQINWASGNPIDVTYRFGGPQVTAGERLTSYIPTNGNTVTRASDYMKLSDTAFSNIFPANTPRTNLLRSSHMFDANAWSVKAGCSISTNVTTDPAGIGGVADKIVENTSLTDHYVEQFVDADLIPPNMPITASIYVKAAERTSFHVNLYNGSSRSGGIYLTVNNLNTTPTFSSNQSGSGQVLAAQVQNIGSGWYRIALSGIVGSAGGVWFRCQMINGSTTYTGDGTSGLIVSSAQIEKMPVEIAPNRIAFSEDFDASPWVKTGVTVTSDAGDAPDGSPTADKLSRDASTGTHFVQSNIITSEASKPYTFSVSLKAADASTAFVGFTGGGGGDSGIYFNLTNGTVASTFGNPLAYTSNSLTDGWWRFSITTTTPSAASFAARVGFVSGAGTAGIGVYVWGANLLQSNVASSYVPLSAVVSPPIATTSTPVTQFINVANEGFVILDVTLTMQTQSTNRNIVQLDNDTGSIRYLIRVNGTASTVTAYNLPASTGGFSLGTFTAGVPFRVGFTWKEGIGYFVGPSGTVIASNSKSLAPRTQLRIACGNGGGEQMNGRVQQVAIGRKWLTNAELQAACVYGAPLPQAK